MIALVDCNSFFCSCERLFRPDLNRIPVGVLSNNDGCFISRTKELKRLGVKMGEPYFKVRNLCEKNNVAVFSSNFSLYTNISDRVMKVLVQFAPEIEVYSIDEAFLNLSGFSNYNLAEYGKRIKDIVMKHTGIPVSVGIATTKTLSKIANNYAKKNIRCDGVVVLEHQHEIDKVLIETPVDNIWGVGKKTSIKLKLQNISNAKQFRDYDNDKNIQRIFTKKGRQTLDELRGISCLKLTEKVEKKKEIMCTRTFGSSIFDLSKMKQMIASYATTAAEKLRRQDSICAKVEVFFRTDIHKNTAQHFACDNYKFQTQTQDTRKIIKYSWQVLDLLFKYGYEYKRAGIRLTDLDQKSNTQINLFEKSDSHETLKLMEVVDRINRREGKETVKFAACGVDNRSWKMNQRLKSPRYVTGWEELCKCK